METRIAPPTSLETRQDRTTRNLVRLLQRRHDLRGVYAPADHIAELLHWSA